jgi:MscS family membrane protein
LNVPVKLTSLEKLPAITSEIRTMLESHPKVFLEDEKPRCYVSQVNASSFNIVICCNLKSMSEDEFLVVQEAVLLESSRIVVRNGGALGVSM